MIVVDASFLVAVLLEETHTDFARDVLDTHQSERLVAPGLVTWELANVLWKKLRTGEISAEHLAGMADYVDSLRLEHPSWPDGVQIAALAARAERTGLSAYDAAYLVLALELSATLATADRGLTRAAVAEGLAVLSPFA